MSVTAAQREPSDDALWQGDNLFHAILGNVSDLILVRDLQQKCRYASPSHLSRLGYSVDELLGTDLLALIHPEDVATVVQAAAQVTNDLHPHAISFRHRHKNGAFLHVEATLSALRKPVGPAHGLVFVSRVVDERVAAEQKLHAAYAEIESFLHSIPSILIGLDARGRITRWNLTAVATFGLPGADVIGRMIQDCGIKWSQADIAVEVGRWLETTSARRIENLGFEREGQSRFLGFHVRRLPAQEHGTALVLIGADVTERKSLEEQLRQAQKLEAIGQLAAGVAHEINTPTQYVGDNARFLKDSWEALAGMLELTKKMREQAKSGCLRPELLAEFDRKAEQSDVEYLLKEIPSAIDQALDGVQRVAKIVQGMKEFSHPGSEDKRAVDLNKAIESTITVARHEWKYVATLITHFDEDLPAVPCLVGEFNQVILNLLINAAHAIADAVQQGRTEKGAITITTRHDGPWAEIAIRDTGEGIPEGIRSRIFEPFFTTKLLGKGTGQGLALAHTVIVNRHQGQIWFQSEIGKGTTFFIRLPIAAQVPEHD